MKKLLFTLLALAGLVQAQSMVTVVGRQQWGDSLRWGDKDDSSGYLRIRGQSKYRDSAGAWRALSGIDSCSLPYKMGFTTLPNSKLELSYEVRTSAGNTDSSQVKFKIDSRYCRGAADTLHCESWVPAGRFQGDTTTMILDSIITVATSSGTTWKPSRNLFDVPGGTQIRLCVDGYKTGTSATDTTFFRRFVIRTSSVPAGGTPPSSVSVSGTGLATSANQTNASQKTQIVDGSGNVVGTTTNALDVNIKSGSSSGAVAQGSTTAGQTGGLTQAAVTTAAPSYTTGQTNPLSLNTSGGLRVDPSGVTSPVSLASVPSHPVTNAGTFAVQETSAPADPFGANADAASATGSISAKLRFIAGTGIPVTSSALPTGAATAAKQPALGTAGTASTDVITVQGITSMTPLKTDPSGVTSPVSYATTGHGTATGALRVELPTDGTGLVTVNPGTAANWGVGATGSPVPPNAVYLGTNGSGNNTGLIQADGSVKIDVSTATTTQLVALASSKKIYVTSWDVVAAGTGTIKLVYGTGSSCGTGTTDLTGAYSLVAQAGLSKGNGLGPVLVVPASNALCVTTSQAVGMQGSVSYTQF